MTASASSKFLAERLIARLSPQRRANLQRRITDRLELFDARAARHVSTRQQKWAAEAACERQQRMLGRLAALT